MLKRNSGFILLVLLLGTLVYQVMLHITANGIEGTISDLEQDVEYLQEQIDELKGY